VRGGVVSAGGRVVAGMSWDPDGRTGTRRRRRRIRIWVTVAASLAVWGAAVLVVLVWHPGEVPARVLCGCHGLSAASAIAVDGAHVWVVSDPLSGDGSVTELNASDGSWVRTLSGGRYGFRYPSAIAADGTHIWVANDPETGDGEPPQPGDGSVTELNASDGSWVRTLSGSNYGFDFPSAIVADGTRVWVANPFSAGDGGSVTELNASNGSLIWTASGGSYGFNDPSAVVRDGAHIWVTNRYPAGNGGSVTELNASDGSWVQTLSGGCYDFDGPAGIAADGDHIWVVSSPIGQVGGSVTELNAKDGSWARTLSKYTWLLALHGGCARDLLAGSYGFSNPALIAAVGTHVWILDGTLTVLTPR
jgi:hypothetical protein